jgi:hypothetical protein
MIELKQDSLEISFPEVHPAARLGINLQRTLRIPDDNQTYPLPAGLGRFPLHHVDDYSERVPPAWREHGGVFLPMYQAEAMWICFQGAYPFALKLAAGKVNVVTGSAWSDALSADPQDYVVTPGQPWVDGFCVKKGLIRQFVAMRLGEGYTAEEQITGEGVHGGLQIIAYPMKRERYEQYLHDRQHDYHHRLMDCLSEDVDMGLAPGGLMRQDISGDPFGIDAYDLQHASRCFLHIANSQRYSEVTGLAPPPTPVTRERYASAGIPWFDYYDKDLKPVEAQPPLAGLDGIAAKGLKKGETPLEDNAPVVICGTVDLSPRRKGEVRDGKF